MEAELEEKKAEWAQMSDGPLHSTLSLRKGRADGNQTPNCP